MSNPVKPTFFRRLKCYVGIHPPVIRTAFRTMTDHAGQPTGEMEVRHSCPVCEVPVDLDGFEL